MAGYRNAYVQEYKTQGAVAYDGNALRPVEYVEENMVQRKHVTYEYKTYDSPYSRRDIIFKIPFSMLRR
jgi:hypothetical protein